MPCLRIWASVSSALSASFTAPDILSTTSRGVPAGASKPYQMALS